MKERRSASRLRRRAAGGKVRSGGVKSMDQV
jgi:hypothetical protein